MNGQKSLYVHSRFQLIFKWQNNIVWKKNDANVNFLVKLNKPDLLTNSHVFLM